ncbi:MAG: hypothetical protein AAFR66_17055 [Bacteroidota bacterium]
MKENHNAKYPTKAENPKAPKHYRSNAPERLHDSHMQTLYLLLMDYADDQERRKVVEASEYLSLSLKTNNAKAQKKKRDKRTTSRHLARLTEAGFLLSETCDKSQEFPQGIKPKKIFHGSSVGYTLFFAPEFVRAATTLPEFRGLYNTLTFSTMETKFPDNIEDLPKELIISQKASVPDICTEEEPQKINGGKVLNQKDSEENILPAAAAQNYSLSLHHQLAQKGQLVIAYALMIVDAYIKKLAPAMGKEIHQNEVRRAKAQVIRLLQSADNLEAFTDRICATIDHMQRWIELDPDKNFVPLPSYWFNPDYRYNIVSAEKKYLLPYLQKGKLWKEKREKAEGEKHSFQTSTDQQKMKNSGYHDLAGQMKKAFRKHHPGDSRLFSADLNKWAKHIQLLIDKDKRSPSEVVAVANWLLNSGSKKASYWLKDAGGFGLRSASGFRRNYTSILQQYGQDKATKYTHGKA